jgi:lysozyme family protein
MRGNFSACADFTLAAPQDGQPFHITAGDPGGATTWGVTRATLSRWRHSPASLDDVKALTITEARKIYKAWYYDTISGDDLPAGVDLMVFDHGVVAGEVCSAKLLQKALNVEADGAIGQITMAAVNAVPPAALVSRLRTYQEQDFKLKSDFYAFGHGWLNRLFRRYNAATVMVATAADKEPPSGKVLR